MMVKIVTGNWNKATSWWLQVTWFLLSFSDTSKFLLQLASLRQLDKDRAVPSQILVHLQRDCQQNGRSSCCCCTSGIDGRNRGNSWIPRAQWGYLGLGGVCWTKVTVTKCHKPSGLKYRNLLSYSSVDKESEIKVPAGLFPSENCDNLFHASLLTTCGLLAIFDIPWLVDHRFHLYISFSLSVSKFSLLISHIGLGAQHTIV